MLWVPCFLSLTSLPYILGRVEFSVDVTPTNKCPSFPRICWNSMVSHIYDLFYSSYFVYRNISNELNPFYDNTIVVLIPLFKYNAYLDSREFLV